MVSPCSGFITALKDHRQAQVHPVQGFPPAGLEVIPQGAREKEGGLCLHSLSCDCPSTLCQHGPHGLSQQCARPRPPVPVLA